MPVNTTDKIEEVTKHSVHTLVFRSLKRTHDMFISDQGALPALDPKAADLSKKVKARATYGPIMATVELNRKRQKAAGLEQMNNFAITHEEASNTDIPIPTSSETNIPSNELAVYQSQGNSGGISGNTGASNIGSSNIQVIYTLSKLTSLF